jgi:hypothetical protein
MLAQRRLALHLSGAKIFSPEQLQRRPSWAAFFCGIFTMLRLSLQTEPSWLELGHGVRLLVEPLSTPVLMAARSDPAVIAVAGDTADSDEADTPRQDDRIAVIVAKAVARLVVKDWEGVGDADGQPIKPTPDGIDALLDIWPIFEAFQTEYIAGALILEQEKNA